MHHSKQCGGDITKFTELCEEIRRDAFERMTKQAVELGANAVLGVQCDATEVMPGVTEVHMDPLSSRISVSFVRNPDHYPEAFVFRSF